jgi:hypothetical protein
MLCALLTVLLPIAAVWGGHILLRDSETLIFAVGAPDRDEARFAAATRSACAAINLKRHAGRSHGPRRQRGGREDGA